MTKLNSFSLSLFHLECFLPGIHLHLWCKLYRQANAPQSITMPPFVNADIYLVTIRYLQSLDLQSEGCATNVHIQYYKCCLKHELRTNRTVDEESVIGDLRLSCACNKYFEIVFKMYFILLLLRYGQTLKTFQSYFITSI